MLVAEDEQLLADAIAEGLRREGLAVDVAYDGEAALERRVGPVDRASRGSRPRRLGHGRPT